MVMCMKIIQVNDGDDISDDLKDRSGIEIIFYHYEYGDYSGNGDALVLKNGKWGYVNLGHCSCYDFRDNLDESHPEHAQPQDILKKASTDIFDFVTWCLWIGYELGIFEKPGDYVKPWYPSYRMEVV